MTQTHAAHPAEFLIARRENSRRSLSVVFSVLGLIFQIPLTFFAVLGYTASPDALFMGALYFTFGWPFLGAMVIISTVLAFRLRRSLVAKTCATVSLLVWICLVIMYWPAVLWPLTTLLNVVLLLFP